MDERAAEFRPHTLCVDGEHTGGGLTIRESGISEPTEVLIGAILRQCRRVKPVREP